MTAADRALIEQLLEDPSLSCRAIARRTGYSDWTIRKIARAFDGDPRPMRQPKSYAGETPPDAVSSVAGWLVMCGVVAAIALVVWAGSRWMPPPDL